MGEPDLSAELDAAEEIVMGGAMPEWYVIIPGAPWGGKTAVFGPYISEDDARAEFARTRALSGGVVEPRLARTVETAAGED